MPPRFRNTCLFVVKGERIWQEDDDDNATPNAAFFVLLIPQIKRVNTTRKEISFVILHANPDCGLHLLADHLVGGSLLSS